MDSRTLPLSMSFRVMQPLPRWVTTQLNLEQPSSLSLIMLPPLPLTFSLSLSICLSIYLTLSLSIYIYLSHLSLFLSHDAATAVSVGNHSISPLRGGHTK